MPGVIDTACYRARVCFPHKVINNIILHRWKRWKKAEFPKGNSIKRQQFCECQRERTWIRARDWHGAFLINIYWMEKKGSEKVSNCYIKSFGKTQKNSPPHCSNLRQLSVEREFFNYLVFRLSTLNLTIHFAAESLPLAWRGGMGASGNFLFEFQCPKVRSSEKQARRVRSSSVERFLRMWMCLSCCFWLPTEMKLDAQNLLMKKFALTNQFHH